MLLLGGARLAPCAFVFLCGGLLGGMLQREDALERKELGGVVDAERDC